MAQWASDLTEMRLKQAICAGPSPPTKCSTCPTWLLTNADVSGGPIDVSAGAYVQLVGGSPVGQPALFLVTTSATTVTPVTGLLYYVIPTAVAGANSVQAVASGPTPTFGVVLTWVEQCSTWTGVPFPSI